MPATSEWSPKIDLIISDCETITIRTKCPKLDVERNMEIMLIRHISGQDVVISNIDKRCQTENPIDIEVQFTIPHRGFYRVNVSLSPDASCICDELCSQMHASGTWLLGNMICDKDLKIRCQNGNDKSGESSISCAPNTIQQKFSDWKPAIKLITTNQEQFTVEAVCPLLYSKRTLEFHLHVIDDGKEVVLETIARKCGVMSANVVRADFSMPCNDTFRINVTLSPKFDFECDEFCTTPHTSGPWISGNKMCSKKLIIGCNLGNKCTTTKGNYNSLHAKKFNNGVISLIVIIPLIVLGLVALAFVMTKRYRKRQFQYQKTDGILMV